MKVLYVFVGIMLLQACSSTPKVKPITKPIQRISYDQSMINVLNKQNDKKIAVTHWVTIRKQQSFKCLSALGLGYKLDLAYELAPNKTLARVQKKILFEPNELKKVAKQGHELIQNCGASSAKYQVDYINNNGKSAHLSSNGYPIQARRDGIQGSCEVTYLLGKNGKVKEIQNVDCGRVTRIFAKPAIMKAARFYATPEELGSEQVRTSTINFEFSQSN